MAKCVRCKAKFHGSGYRQMGRVGMSNRTVCAGCAPHYATEKREAKEARNSPEAKAQRKADWDSAMEGYASVGRGIAWMYRKVRPKRTDG